MGEAEQVSGTVRATQIKTGRCTYRKVCEDFYHFECFHAASARRTSSKERTNEQHEPTKQIKIKANINQGRVMKNRTEKERSHTSRSLQHVLEGEMHRHMMTSPELFSFRCLTWMVWPPKKESTHPDCEPETH